MKGAELFAKCLVQHGVKFLFGIPGAKIDALFDALLDTPIKVILCRHEQNAAFMAGIVGRLTGQPGVVLVTSGPGVSNLVTGLLTATTEGDPMVAIGGGVPRAMKLKESHQSADNIKLTEGATKQSWEVLLADNIPEIVDNAFRTAASPRSGAIFISIPQDVLNETASVKPHRAIPPILFGHDGLSSIDQAAKWIEKAKNPVLLLGLESSRPENTKAIRDLLSKTRIASVNTFQAAGVLSRDLLDCFVGRVGLFKNQPGDELLDRADVVVAIGYSAVEYNPEIWNAKKGKKIIHIDYNAANIHSSYVPEIEILGDIASNLQELKSRLPVRKQIREQMQVQKLQNALLDKRVSRSKGHGPLVHPLQFIADLRKAIDDKTIVVSDIGTHYMWLARYFLTYSPHHLLFSNGQQTLGVALPWAIAAKLVRPKSKVISISGDGGFLFSAMELETAVREKLPIVHCVWCDGAYDMVRQQQLMKYHRESCVAFGPVDLVQFAESFGAIGFRVSQSDELLPILKKAFSMNGPVIVEIPIDYSDNAALFKTVHESYWN
jgi:acetolactate synthase I/II/III large subunit